MVSTTGQLFGDKGEMEFPWKWPELGKSVTGSLTTANANKKSGDVALNEYITRYLANYAPTKTYTDQEVGAVTEFYNGQIENQLAQLRARQKAAGLDAANLYSNRALRSVNQGLVGTPGAGSSYGNRLQIGAMVPYQVEANLADANQERADFGYLTQNRLGLAGRRQNMLNSLAGYGLVPEQTRQQFYANYLNNLGALENLFNSGTYSQYNPSTTEIIGSSLQQAGSTLMGGGGASTPTNQSNIQLGPPQSSRPYAEYAGTWSPTTGYASPSLWGSSGPVTSGAPGGSRPADWWGWGGGSLAPATSSGGWGWGS
ncbi:MAG: hypothetical protein WC655_03530 [Candidatus Hydrogenedentales bacterium]|jgi:hypothetical protein